MWECSLIILNKWSVMNIYSPVVKVYVYTLEFWVVPCELFLEFKWELGILRTSLGNLGLLPVGLEEASSGIFDGKSSIHFQDELLSGSPRKEGSSSVLPFALNCLAFPCQKYYWEPELCIELSFLIMTLSPTMYFSGCSFYHASDWVPFLVLQ